MELNRIIKTFMKVVVKVLSVIIFIVCFLFVSLDFYMHKNRHHRFSDGEYITMRDFGNVKCVIPGSYHGISMPKENYMLIKGSDDIFMFYIGNKTAIANFASGSDAWHFVNLSPDSGWRIIEYSESCDTLLYDFKDGKKIKLKNNVERWDTYHYNLLSH